MAMMPLYAWHTISRHCQPEFKGIQLHVARCDLFDVRGYCSFFVLESVGVLLASSFPASAGEDDAEADADADAEADTDAGLACVCV